MKNKLIFLLARIALTAGVMIWIIASISSCIKESDERREAKCEHKEIRKEYSFNPPTQTGSIGVVKNYCKVCDNYLGITYLHGTPSDLSYLDVIREHSDSSELIDGEYYTMTAVVTVAYYYGSISINCKVRDEDTVVYFSACFREEFKDEVSYLVLVADRYSAPH